MLSAPLLVVAYGETARQAIVAEVERAGGSALALETFAAAETFLLGSRGAGLLVDLATMIKAKDEEKQIACTIMNFLPALRLKVVGPMVVPMAMPGDAAQDKTLTAFIDGRCRRSPPRMLRGFRRREACLPVVIGGRRGFVANVSWGGIFVVDFEPELLAPGAVVSCQLCEEGATVDIEVVHVVPWGAGRPPGFGGRFVATGDELRAMLARRLRSDPATDRDRATLP